MTDDAPKNVYDALRRGAANSEPPPWYGMALVPDMDSFLQNGLPPMDQIEDPELQAAVAKYIKENLLFGAPTAMPGSWAELLAATRATFDWNTIAKTEEDMFNPQVEWWLTIAKDKPGEFVRTPIYAAENKDEAMFTARDILEDFFRTGRIAVQGEPFIVDVQVSDTNFEG